MGIRIFTLGCLTLFVAVSEGANVFWTNHLGGSWSQAANWSPNRAPTSSDKAFITNNGTYRITIDNATVASALTLGGSTGTQTLAVVRNTLILSSGNSTVGSNGVLNLEGGVIDGGTLIVNGTLNWAENQIRSSVTVSSSGQLNLSGNGDKTLARTLNNNGTVTWSGGGFVLLDGVNVINSGLFEILQDDAPTWSGNITRPTFDNRGILRKVSATGTTVFDKVRLVNSGLLDVQSGIVSFRGNTHTFSDRSELRGSGQIWIDGATVMASGTITNDQSFEIRSGTLLGTNSFAGPLRMTGGTLNSKTTILRDLSLEGGVILGSLTVNGLLDWTVGQVSGLLIINKDARWVGGVLTGTLNVSPAGRLSISNNTCKMDGGRLSNAGTTIIESDSLLILANTVSITNKGIFQIISASPFSPLAGASATFLNEGTFRATASGATTLSEIQFENRGRIEVENGTLSFPSGKIAFGLGSSITGVGQVQLSGADVSIVGSLSNTIPLVISSGSFLGTGRIGGALVIDGGTLGGSLTVDGSLVLSGGQITNVLIIPTNGTARILDNSTVELRGGRLINYGTLLTEQRGGLRGSGNSSVDNYGLFVAANDSAYIYAGTGRPTLNNFGTFIKGASGVMAFSDVQLNNGGRIEVQGGTLELTANNHNFTSGLITGAGAVRLSGATLSLGTNVSVETFFEFSSGLLQGRGTFQADWTWSGGTITGSLTHAVGRMVTLAGDKIKTLAPGAILENQGLMTVTGAGSLEFGNAALLRNRSTLELQSDNPFVIIAAASATFVNSGLVSRTSSAQAVDFQKIQLINNGVLDLVSAGMTISAGSHRLGAGTHLIGATRFAVTGGNLSLDGTITSSSPLEIVSGSLTGKATVEGNLLLSGGTITSNITVTGAVVWSGGQVAGGLNLPQGSSLNMTSVGAKLLTGVITNSGQANLAASAFLQMENGAVFHNMGTFECSSVDPWRNTAGARPVFVNVGLFRKLGISNSSMGSDVEFRNSGTIEIAGDSLAFVAGTHSFNNQSRISGSGLVTIDGATINLSGTVFVSAPLTFASGLITGNGSLNGNWRWLAGTINGSFTHPAGMELTLSGGGTKTLGSSASFRNDGSAIVEAGVFQFADGAVFNNNGVFELQSERLQTTGGAARSILNNTGTLRKSVSNRPLNFDLIELRNTGIIEAQNGVLSFTSGTHALSDRTVLSGSGKIQIQGATINVNGTIEVNSLFELASGSLAGNARLNGAVTISGGQVTGTFIAAGLSWAGGQLAGSLTLTDAGNWSGGQLSGLLAVSETAQLTISGVGGKTLTGVLTNSGTIVHAETALLQMDAGGQVRNGGLFDCFNEQPWKYTTGARPAFINTGLFRKSAIPDLEITAAVEFRQSGLVEVATNAFSFKSGTHSVNNGSRFTGAGLVRLNGASLTVLGNATVMIPFEFSAGTMVGAGMLQGNVTWIGGQVSGDLTVGTNSQWIVRGPTLKQLTGSQLNNLGRIDVSAEATIQCGSGFTVANNGLFIVAGNSPFSSPPNTRSSFENYGTLRKESAGELVFSSIELDHYGIFDIKTGSVRFATNSHVFRDDSRILGSGSLKVQGATLNIDGNVFSDVSLEFAGGIIKDDGSWNGMLAWTGGNIAGDLTASGSTTWSGGTLSGLLKIPPGAQMLIIPGGIKRIDSGKLDNGGTISWQTSQAIEGANSSEIDNTGTLNFLGSGAAQLNFTGSAVPKLKNHGVLNLTNDFPVLMSQYQFEQDRSGTLNLWIGGKNPGIDQSQVRVSGNAILDGVLNISLVPGYQLARGDSYEVLTYARRAGAFLQVTGDVQLFGAKYTATNLLLVCVPPEIVVPPLSHAVVQGQNTSFSVVVDGANLFLTQYQWLFNGSPLPFGTNSILTLQDVPASSAGQYSVTVWNVWGTVTSAPATLVVNIPPLITSQPNNTTITVGQDATFNVTVTGTEPFIYQWKFEGREVLGTTNAVFVRTNASTAHAGKYEVEVSNIAGAVTSLEAALTVNVPPTVASQPAAKTVVQGGSVTFSVAAAGTAPFGYQWFFADSALVGATSDKLELRSATVAQAGNYSVVISNVSGIVRSAEALLTVIVPPTITAQPQSLVVTQDQTATFTVAATGTSPFSYEWKRGATVLAEGSFPTLVLTNVQGSQSGRYKVEVSNSAGSISSSEATLTVITPVVITKQPQSRNINQGSDLTLSVEASGTGPLGFQWFRNDTAIPTATSASLTLPRIQLAQAGAYTVAVSNLLGSVLSIPAVIAINTPPAFTLQPVGQSAPLGSTVTLSASATGIPAPKYQWQVNGVKLPGATNATLVISNLQAAHSGRYAVVASNPLGSVMSSIAEIQAVTPPLPFADMFAERGIIYSASGAGHGINIGATKELGESSLAGKGSGTNSIWLRWWAPANGIATFRTVGSAIDTVLAVYTGENMGALKKIASDDDSGLFHSSEVSFNVKAGAYYDIAVAGFGRAAGVIVLSWDLTITAETVPTIVTAPSDQTANEGDTLTLAVVFDASEPVSLQWFYRGAIVPNATNATLTITNLDEIQVGGYYVRITSASGRAVVSRPADVQINTGGQSRVAARNKLGDAVDSGVYEAQVAFNKLALKSAAPGPARGYTSGQIFNSIGADRDEEEPLHCGVAGGASSWFVYRPAIDGTLEIKTDGSSFDTVLAVYTGDATDYASLVSVACDDNSGTNGRTSRVQFSAQAGTTYYIAVDGIDGATGIIRLTYTLGTPAEILTQPLAQDLAVGDDLTLTVVATGTPTLLYQWELDETIIAGATNSILEIRGIQAEQGGKYAVRISNSLNTVISSTAKVRIRVPLQFRHAATANGMELTLSGPVGIGAIVEMSTNLLDWVPIFTNTSPGALTFTTPCSPEPNQRFYRVSIP